MTTDLRLPQSWLHLLIAQLRQRIPAPVPPHPGTMPDRGHGERREHTIIVDTDGSDSTYSVVDTAAELARARHATLLITCVHHPINTRALGLDLDRLHPDDYQLRGTTPTDTILATAHAHATAHGAPTIETHPLTEPALDAIIDLASTRHADMIIIGRPALTRPTERLAARFLDTIPVRLARKAPCDILIIRTP